MHPELNNKSQQNSEKQESTTEGQPDLTRIARLVSELLEAIGEDPRRHGLRHTPARVARNIRRFLGGYSRDPRQVLNEAQTVLERPYENPSPITIGPLDLLSYCEHDLLPMVGEVWVSYIPQDKVVGFSKFREIIEILSCRLQLQEKLIEEIAEIIQNCLNPRGLAVLIRARHYCMTLQGAPMNALPQVITTRYTGEFLHNNELCTRFLQVVGQKK